MGQTTWTGAQLGHELSGCRVAGDDLLLAFNEHVPDEYTLGLWHMNEGAGNIVADAGGNYPITLSAANWWTPGWMGSGLAATAAGTASPIVPLNGGGDYTVEFWFKVSSNTMGYKQWEVFSCRTAWNQNNVLMVMRSANTFYVSLRTYDSASTLVNCDYSTNDWVGAECHVAAVRENNTLRLYRNGVQVKSISAPAGNYLDPTATLVTASAIAEAVGFDELRVSDICRYPNGTTFYPIRYPASGTGTADSATGAASKPGLLTVTLAEALPAGTSLKAKLLSTGGGDTGFQTLTGSGTTYTYDFTGAAAGTWYPALQLFAGGTMNANTPTVTQAALDWTPAYTFRPYLFPSRLLGGLS